MIGEIKKAFQEIEKLPKKKQLELAQLIQDELNWDKTFLQSQDKLSQLAEEALAEYNTVELKSSLHKILDNIENEQLLRVIYDFLKQRENPEEGQIWKTLTEEQKREVYLSYEESNDDNNLIEWKDIKKRT